jgi:RNA polymerase primary sigma factor
MRRFSISRQIANRESAALEKYLQEISRVDLITAEEEARLAQKIKLGDERAMEQLTKANLRFVVSVAKQYQNRGLPLADLINEGNIGLVKATKKFDGTRGFKLISYAVWWIRQCIQNAIDEQSRLVRLPSGKSDMIKKIKKVAMQLEQEFEREPSYGEMEKQISLPAEAIENIMNASSRQISIDTPLAGSDNLTLSDVIEDKSNMSPEQDLFNESLVKELESIISALPLDEAEVLRLFFGLGGKQPMTFAEISVHLGCTPEQIGPIKEKALQRLKHNSRCKALKEYLVKF